MAGNRNLHAAAAAKKDEFYTQLPDIANELTHYKRHFRGKTVLCNCDDPYKSNFFKFFALKFEEWGLRKLMCTCYHGMPAAGLKVELTGAHGVGAADTFDVKAFLRQNPPTRLQGNGDFRSPECQELLKEADIVVTNPPFSLFREYMAQLMDGNKKFLIIGHQNAISYKEIFSFIKANKLWLGYGFKGGAAHFISCYEDVATAGHHKEGMIRVSGVQWFTNLDHDKRHEALALRGVYSAKDFPRYLNYDAIEVSRTANIPMDYDGQMGVPITFLNKYSPEQFEILGNNLELADMNVMKPLLGKLNGGPSFYLNKNGTPTRLYARLIIRRKQ